MTTPWKHLLEAHAAVQDEGRHDVPRHQPAAAIITCSDARVSPSVIFDQPAGSLFVVRIAGNTATPAVIASIDFAVEELGVPLIVVLGHTHCGAVAAAKAGHCTGYLAPLTSQLCGLVHGGEIDLDELTELNVLATIHALAASESPVGRAIRTGRVAVEGAVYDLASDSVRPLASITNPTNTNRLKETTKI